MNSGIKITIEEWAGDNGIKITDKQIEELCDGIDVAHSMSLPNGYGVEQIKTNESLEIRSLKNQIDLLKRFIESKGYNITIHDDRIEQFNMTDNGLHSASNHTDFK